MLDKLKALPHELIFALGIILAITGNIFTISIGLLLVLIAFIKRYVDKDDDK